MFGHQRPLITPHSFFDGGLHKCVVQSTSEIVYMYLKTADQLTYTESQFEDYDSK